MKLSRRTLLLTAAATIVATGMPNDAVAKTVNYSSDTFNEYVSGGKTFLMGIHAKWCSTCDRQNRVINALRTQGEPYNNLTVLAVDWDEHRSSPLIADLNVPRRSTLIMFKDGKEVGRIVAGTGEAQIQELIDKGF